MLLSIVVPCYNEQEILQMFYAELIKHLSALDTDYEIIFIDDGSTDATLPTIKQLAKNNPAVRYLSFSRNFGKESAIYAGLEKSNGDYVVLMDADLQDPPALLSEMFDKLQSDEYDCIATFRATRDGEPIIRSAFAKIFYELMHKTSNIKVVPGARDFRMMKRKMVDAVVNTAEYNRFSKGIFSWVGFNTFWISYDNVNRTKGKTKWSFWDLVLYALDGIFSFSTLPLLMLSFSGILLCVVSLIMMFFVVIRTVIFGDPVAGYPSMMSVILFLGGIQLLGISIIAKYLSKIYLETKHRPIYIERESNL